MCEQKEQGGRPCAVGGMTACGSGGPKRGASLRGAGRTAIGAAPDGKRKSETGCEGIGPHEVVYII